MLTRLKLGSDRIRPQTKVWGLIAYAQRTRLIPRDPPSLNTPSILSVCPAYATYQIFVGQKKTLLNLNLFYSSLILKEKVHSITISCCFNLLP